MKKRKFVLLIVILANSLQLLAVDLKSNFNNSDEGWRVIGDAESFYPYYNSSEGYCYAVDKALGGVWYWLAPEQFLGNMSSSYNQNMSFDLKQSSIKNQFDSDDVIIQGTNGIELVYHFDNHPSTDWTHYDIMLTETFWKYTNGDSVSNEVFLSVLSSLSSLKIRGEFVTGEDVGSFDNFVMQGNLYANFDVDKKTAEVGEIIYFTDKTISTEEIVFWEWDFNGDSIIDSYEENPKFAYNEYGDYSVSLKVKTLNFENYKLERLLIRIKPKYLMFSDDFETDRFISDWDFIFGKWDITNGNLVQSSNYYTEGYIGGAFALTGSDDWNNYSVSADMMSTDNDKIGLIINYQNDSNFYFLSWSQQDNYLQMSKYIEGNLFTLASKDTSYVINQYMNARIENNSGNIRVFLDSILIFDVFDLSLKSGRAGLYCHGNQNSYWDNFKVCALEDGVTTLINNKKSIKNLRIYPNPVGDFVNFQLLKKGEIIIIDMSGNVLMKREGIVGENRVNIQKWNRGMYIIRISYEDGKESSSKMIK